MSKAEARKRFLEGMSAVASGVTIVTTDGAAGWAGVTVTAMTSVSADAAMPTLLVCIHEQSPAVPAIITNQAFCVNVLRHDQAHVSDAFAGRFKAPEKDKFVTGTWTTMATGAPRLEDALTAFDCTLAAHHKVGTHVVMLGAVTETFVGPPGATLLYFQRGYHAPVRLDARSAEALDTEGVDASDAGGNGAFGWLKRTIGRS